MPSRSRPIQTRRSTTHAQWHQTLPANSRNATARLDLSAGLVVNASYQLSPVTNPTDPTEMERTGVEPATSGLHRLA